MRDNNFLRILLILSGLVIGLLLLSSCQNPKIIARETITVTSSHTPSFAIKPTQTIKLIITPTSTFTLIPSDTPSPPAFSMPESYTLPNWVADSSNVLTIITDITETANQLSFINAKTHEQFALVLPSVEIRGYFWIPDGQYLGFLTNDGRSVYLLSITDGEIEKLSVSERATRLLSSADSQNHLTLEMLRIYGSFSDDSVVFYSCHFCYSTDLSYEVSVEYPPEYHGEPQVRLENIRTGNKVDLTKLDDNLYDFETVWSPRSTEIAILQGPQPSDIDYQWYPSWPGNQIAVYNAETGEITATYRGDFADIRDKWSPDGKNILYRNLPESREYAGTKLCILALETNQSNCITSIQNSDSSTFSDFSWSPDGDKIYYVRHTQAPQKHDLCIYDLDTQHITCPTKSIPDLGTFNIEEYIASPDGQYFLIAYGMSCSTCDFWGQPSVAIVREDGNDFVFIGQQVGKELANATVYYPTLSQSLWRPIIKP